MQTPVDKTAVIATRFVIDRSDPITYMNNSGGTLMFTGDSDVADSDMMVVSLGDIVKIDESVRGAIENLPEEGFASRGSSKEPWSFGKCDE